jgi:RNA polymerase sigma factor (sigma-70 family)
VAIGESFQSVLAAARLGEQWAWAALYREVSPPVLRYLRARGAREPEDLLGEVCVSVVRGISAFSGGESEFRAWAFTIARNRLTDDWRRRGRLDPVPTPEVELDAVLEATSAAAGCYGDLDHVMAVMQCLSPDQRDVLFLRVLGGLTVGEVAVVLGKRPGAVKALQVRALGAIRRQLLAEAVSL